MNWNVITKQIKMFLDKHPDAPFNIQITSFDNQKVRVIMTKYLQPEEDDLEVDGKQKALVVKSGLWENHSCHTSLFAEPYLDKNQEFVSPSATN